MNIIKFIQIQLTQGGLIITFLSSFLISVNNLIIYYFNISTFSECSPYFLVANSKAFIIVSSPRSLN